MKIKYFDGTKVLEIEVTEKVAEGYRQIKRDEWRLNKQILRHQTAISLTQMEDENGYQNEDLILSDILDDIIEIEKRREAFTALRKGLKTLTKEQKELIYLRFVKSYTIKDAALHFGTSLQAVKSRLKKIMDKLKKFF